MTNYTRVVSCLVCMIITSTALANKKPPEALTPAEVEQLAGEAVRSRSEDKFRKLSAFCVLKVVPEESAADVAQTLYLWPKMLERKHDRLEVGDDSLRVAAFSSLIDSCKDVSTQIELIAIAGKAFGYGRAFEDGFREWIKETGVQASWSAVLQWKYRRLQEES